MNSSQLYITDLDGTLANTLSANILAYSRSFAELDLYFDKAQYCSMFGLRADDMIRKFYPDATSDLICLIQKTKQRHYAQVMQNVRPRKALLNFLNKKKGIVPLALASTARRINGENVLRAIGALDLFDFMIFGEDVARGKPNPECYIKCIKYFGLDPKNVTVFEDTNEGAEAGLAAGAVVYKLRSMPNNLSSLCA